MSGPLLQTATSIVCPSVDGQAVVLDMAQVYAIEARVQEVAFVNHTKAPELLARFNEAWLYVQKHMTTLKYELLRAERAANKIKSVILLDKIPVILKAKGLVSPKSPAGSEDLRNAILDQDEEYQEALDQTQKLKCVIELLKGKMDGFEMAFTSVKKILGESEFMGPRNPGCGTGNAPVGGQNPDPMETPGFGKARYSSD